MFQISLKPWCLWVLAASSWINKCRELTIKSRLKTKDKISYLA